MYTNSQNIMTKPSLKFGLKCTQQQHISTIQIKQNGCSGFAGLNGLDICVSFLRWSTLASLSSRLILRTVTWCRIVWRRGSTQERSQPQASRSSSSPRTARKSCSRKWLQSLQPHQCVQMFPLRAQMPTAHGSWRQSRGLLNSSSGQHVVFTQWHQPTLSACLRKTGINWNRKLIPHEKSKMFRFSLFLN